MQALALVMVVVVAVAVTVTTGEKKHQLGYVHHEGCRMFKPPGPHDRSILLSEASGRLGNNLLMYALMYQLKVSLNVDAYINDECFEYLRKFFLEDSIMVKSIQREFCNYDEIKWVFYYKHMRSLLVDKSYREGKTLYLFPRTGEDGDFSAYRAESHTCIEHEKLMKAYQRSMRKTLKFRPEIMERVYKVFDGVAAKMHKPKKDLTFVGIHNRRTDHLEYTKKKQKRNPLKADYFYDAMDKYREEYDNPVFLFVSDEMEWGRKNIKDKHGDLFFVGEGIPTDDLSIGVDLAIMANCNNTIISRGTFSMWGAILSGGEYHTEYGMVMPDHVMHPEDFLHETEFIL